MLSNIVPEVNNHNWFLQLILETNAEYKLRQCSVRTCCSKIALVNNEKNGSGQKYSCLFSQI